MINDKLGKCLQLITKKGLVSVNTSRVPINSLKNGGKDTGPSQ